jgi:hypothetical protein
LIPESQAGRSRTLRQVIDHYNSDYDFLVEEKFSNPFRTQLGDL